MSSRSSIDLSVGVGFGIILGQWDPPFWGYLVAGLAFGLIYAFVKGFVGGMWRDLRGL